MDEGQEAEFNSQDEDYLVAHIDNISVSNLGFIVFLKADSDNRVVPIFIGPNEAQSIAIAYNNQVSPRPLTHDLMKNMLGMLDCEVTKVMVTSLQDNTFHGRIHFRKEGFEEQDIDARPSDAIALAIRYKVPILIHKDVYETAGIIVKEKEESAEENQDQVPDLQPSPINPVEKLKNDLQQALAEERYEEAAKLRDELKRMETGN